MLDLRMLTDNLEETIMRLETRGGDFSYLRELPALQQERLDFIFEVEKRRQKRNEVSKEIGDFKRNKKDATKLLQDVETLGSEIKALEMKLAKIEIKINHLLLITPNLPNKDIPVGKDESSNKEILKHGIIRKFNFPIKDHVSLGEELDILDFQRATKISGSRFVIYKGLAARLELSLIMFMMDLHSQKGYRECLPPYIINEESMYGTGQFPKFTEDSFKLEGLDLYLNATAEIPTINMHRNEILPVKELPLKYVSYTTAFRSEAGSAGRDTRGIIRLHQFNKVELIKFVKPEESYHELDLMLKDSEEVLKQLELPYRVVILSTGDTGFSMSKTYDIEVWIPSQDKYREIGSISNAEAFQARRANIRFKRDLDSKTELVHTLNGTGLAVGRTVVAIMENYQNADGTITIPKVLIPYMKTGIIK